MSKTEGAGKVGALVRTFVATGSVVGSFAAGLPIYLLNGSLREARNFSLSLFGETASALIGLKLNVTGEEHLWARRPAVFVMNHQSKVDVLIVAKLLRRDFAGIGKIEIKKESPILGGILELGGTVFIDRSSGKKAVEALKPLVELMRDEGISVAIAPEGTRTETAELAPFKKGAFHLAQQAGVPIIPIVIHNAGKLAPKGQLAIHSGTVDIEVLSPVETGSWKASTIDEHVREVRNLFARTLGQDAEEEEQ